MRYWPGDRSPAILGGAVAKGRPSDRRVDAQDAVAVQARPASAASFAAEPGALPESVVIVVGTLADPPERPDRGRIDARAWSTDPERVRTAFDELRIACTVLAPTSAHDALARLQQVAGSERVLLATTAHDGLLHKASAEDIVELRGSVFRLACAADPHGHPKVPIAGLHHRTLRCVACGAELRPDVALSGEPPRHLEQVRERLRRADLLVLVDVPEDVSQGLVEAARAAGVRAVALPGEDGAVARVVSRWLGDPD